MRNGVLSLFIVGIICASPACMAQDDTKKEVCNAKVEAEAKKVTADEVASNEKKVSVGIKANDPKEKTASADMKSCCSPKKEAITENKSAGKK